MTFDVRRPVASLGQGHAGQRRCDRCGTHHALIAPVADAAAFDLVDNDLVHARRMALVDQVVQPLPVGVG
jgi:hypothetical protein